MNKWFPLPFLSLILLPSGNFWYLNMAIKCFQIADFSKLYSNNKYHHTHKYLGWCLYRVIWIGIIVWQWAMYNIFGYFTIRFRLLNNGRNDPPNNLIIYKSQQTSKSVNSIKVVSTQHRGEKKIRLGNVINWNVFSSSFIFLSLFFGSVESTTSPMSQNVGGLSIYIRC